MPSSEATAPDTAPEPSVRGILQDYLATRRAASAAASESPLSPANLNDSSVPQGVLKDYLAVRTAGQESIRIPVPSSNIVEGPPRVLDATAQPSGVLRDYSANRAAEFGISASSYPVETSESVGDRKVGGWNEAALQAASESLQSVEEKAAPPEFTGGHFISASGQLLGGGEGFCCHLMYFFTGLGFRSFQPINQRCPCTGGYRHCMPFNLEMSWKY